MEKTKEVTEEKLTSVNPYAGVIVLLEEKIARQLGLTPDEVKQKTITIKNGEVTIKGEK